MSGPQARKAAEWLTRLGMSPRVAGERVGQASAIKLTRSIMIKGMEALFAECFLAARLGGVEDEVLASLEASDPDIAGSMAGDVPEQDRHRRVAAGHAVDRGRRHSSPCRRAWRRGQAPPRRCSPCGCAPASRRPRPPPARARWRRGRRRRGCCRSPGHRKRAVGRRTPAGTDSRRRRRRGTTATGSPPSRSAGRCRRCRRSGADRGCP